jgi:hypothetical protein
MRRTHGTNVHLCDDDVACGHGRGTCPGSGQSHIGHNRFRRIGNHWPNANRHGYNGPGGNTLVVIKRVGQRCHRCNAWRELGSIECAHLDPPEREFSGRIYDGISRVCYRFCLDQSSDGPAIAGRGHQQHNGIAGHYSGIPGERPIRHALRACNLFNVGDRKPRQPVWSHVIQRMLMEHSTAIDPQHRPIRGYPGTPADHYG